MKVTLLHTHKNKVKNIEPLIKQVAHISYNKDGDTSEESASKFIQKHVLNAGHHSLLRHAWYTIQTDLQHFAREFDYFDLPNSIRQYFVLHRFGEHDLKVSATLNTWYNYFNKDDDMAVPTELKIISPTLFKNNRDFSFGEADIVKSDYAYTFLIEGCSRLFTHQQVRHTHNFSYNQESTRYVDYSRGFDFVVPPKVSSVVNEEAAKMMKNTSFTNYLYLLSLGIKKEDARYFLPNGITGTIGISINRT